MVGCPVSRGFKRGSLGTRRWFSKVNMADKMAASGKRAWKTNVFWTKDRILLKHLTILMLSVFVHSVVLMNTVKYMIRRVCRFDCKMVS